MLEISVEDAGRLGIADGEQVRVTSRYGEAVLPAAVTTGCVRASCSRPSATRPRLEPAHRPASRSADTHARVQGDGRLHRCAADVGASWSVVLEARGLTTSLGVGRIATARTIQTLGTFVSTNRPSRSVKLCACCFGIRSTGTQTQRRRTRGFDRAAACIPDQASSGRRLPCPVVPSPQPVRLPGLRAPGRSIDPPLVQPARVFRLSHGGQSRRFIGESLVSSACPVLTVRHQQSRLARPYASCASISFVSK